jgi:hypothetical protein
MVRIRFPPAVSQANFHIAPLARPNLVERQPELQCPARASAIALESVLVAQRKGRPTERLMASGTENSNLATSSGVPRDVARGLKHHRLATYVSKVRKGMVKGPLRDARQRRVLPVARARTRSLRFDKPRLAPAGIAVVVNIHVRRGQAPPFKREASTGAERSTIACHLSPYQQLILASGSGSTRLQYICGQNFSSMK